MALICDVELNSGLTLTDAYLRITSFSGSENRINFVLGIYTSKENFTEERPPVSQTSYNISFDKNRNLFNQMYNHLLSLPEYESAKEV